MEPSYDRRGSDPPASPVIVSVSHAGRGYPAELVAALRVPLASLRGLEDRCVDAVAIAAHRGEAMLVQRHARAWIDLNRSEQERDPCVDEGASPVGEGPSSARLRGGLGLVPRRVAAAGDLWRARFTAAAIDRRIVADHRPYHTELERLLAVARRRFGVAVLLDLHSMPPLGRGGARIVIGDRFGRSAGEGFVGAIEGAARQAGVAVARNRPYAGGHIVARHGRPALHIHAVQVELDRSLYLDTRLDQPGPGLAGTAALVRRMIDALAERALEGQPGALLAAAE